MFDSDGNGTLTIEELKTVMESLGQECPDDELKVMIGQLDTTNSGTIDFPEFLKLMSRKMSSSDLNREAYEVRKLTVYVCLDVLNRY